MKRLRKFFGLPAPDRSLLIKATFTVAMVQVGLWVLPFRTLLRFLPRMAQESVEAQASDSVCTDKTIWAVAAASRYMPGATCLTQALAAQVLLVGQGCPSQLTIGVAKSQEGRLEAHAWVESQGQILIGGLKDMTRFTPLPPVSGKTP